MPYYPTRKLTILALDPSVRVGGEPLTTQIEIPNEFLQAGPRGYRAQVIDFDSATNRLLEAAPIPLAANREDGPPEDPFEKTKPSELIGDPAFHAFMVYGVAMKTLSRFEYALGRRVGWSFGGPLLQIAPHAFTEANAFYDPEAQGLFFGYFPDPATKARVYSCLSHEVVAHETTHALLDGLRERYMDPSSPQQAGFHEGFSDIVALLSTLSAPEVVRRAIDLGLPVGDQPDRIRRSALDLKTLRESAVMGLAQEMGGALSGIHGQALRRSVSLEPKTGYLAQEEYEEAHQCGEVLVAAAMNAYLDVWVNRLKALGDSEYVDRDRVVEEGAELADRLLTMCIRAIDYCPPTDLQFGDFASAVLTADWELNPLDSKYRLRERLLASFRAYGIEPSSKRTGGQEGAWEAPPEPKDYDHRIRYDRTHFESMKTDYEELFRFLWENRLAFKLNQQAFTKVLSVRPCVRTGRDGFVLRETVVEYHQRLEVEARELAELGVKKPDGMPDQTKVTLFGGNALVFDEYGLVKYNIGNSILNTERQSERLSYLWRAGYFRKGSKKLQAFARLHRMRGSGWLGALRRPVEEED